MEINDLHDYICANITDRCLCS